MTTMRRVWDATVFGRTTVARALGSFTTAPLPAPHPTPLERHTRLSEGLAHTLTTYPPGASERQLADHVTRSAVTRMGTLWAEVRVLDDDAVLRRLSRYPTEVDDSGKSAEISATSAEPCADALRDHASPTVHRSGGTRVHAVPLSADQTLIGTLSVALPDQGGCPTEHHLLTALAAGLTHRIVSVRREVRRDAQQVHDALMWAATDRLEGVLDPALVLAKAAHLLVPDMADWCTIQLLTDDGLETVVVENDDPGRAAWGIGILRAYPIQTEHDSAWSRALAEGTSQLHTFVPDAMLSRSSHDQEHLETLRSVGITSTLVVPLLDGGDTVLGLITLVQAESARRFTAEDAVFAEAFARRVASHWHTACSFREQADELADIIRIADVAQRAILAPPHEREGNYKLSSRYVSAARAAQVGGDLYEVVRHGSSVRALIGDVRGKGLAAVRTATVVIGEFRSAGSLVPDLARVAQRLDRGLRAHIDEEDFVTALIVELEDDGSGRLVTCGHPPPLLVRAGALHELNAFPAAPLGLDPDPVTTHVQLQPGDRVVLFTDGLLEARLPDRSFVDHHAVLAGIAGTDFPEALDRVLADLTACVGHALDDDLAIVLLEYDPLGP